MLKKYATGIESFDLNIGGGFPQGSIILLLGEVGAGSQEFIYTSISKTAMMKDLKAENFPEKIHYLSFSKSKKDILQEVEYSFAKEHYDSLKNFVSFQDFSEMFKQGEMKMLLNFFGENAKNNSIIIDSLTDFLTSNFKFEEIISFLKTVQREAKEWNGIVYFLLTKDILEKNKEELIADAVDGVIVFNWSGLGSTKRRRDVYIKKFRGLMPRMEQEKIAKLEVKITPKTGFEVANVRMIA